MPESGTVSGNTQGTATQYNNLRKDVLDNSVGHVHSGAAGGGKALPASSIPNLSATKITADRLASIDRLPALTTDKAWKGVAGVPAEVDWPTIPVFTELAGNEGHTRAAEDTWEDWDLSAIVPAGTKSVLVALESAGGLNTRINGARKNGSALVRKGANMIIDANTPSVWLTEVDANRVIEIYDEGALCKFSILGYWS